MAEELVILRVNLNQGTASALQASAKRSNVSLTEATRRAVAILSYIESETDAGRIIQTMDGDGRNRRELVIM